MSRKCGCTCKCAYLPMTPPTQGYIGGFDPCRLALFLLVLKRACIIDHETATILIFLFLLCCKGFSASGMC